MHEMSIVSNVVDVVVKHAEKSGAQKVISVTLVVGELHDVVDDLMESCFKFLARGTIAEGSSLRLVKVPMRAQCKDCLLVYPMNLRDRETLICPDCGSGEFRIYNGNEFIIRDIEIV